MAWRKPPLTLLLLSDDEALVELVRGIIRPPWKIDHRENLRRDDLFRQPNVRLVLVDDGVTKEGERGWLLGQIRRRIPGVPLVYVADSHDLENERRARASGAHYYTSKPVDERQFFPGPPIIHEDAEVSCSLHRGTSCRY